MATPAAVVPDTTVKINVAPSSIQTSVEFFWSNPPYIISDVGCAIIAASFEKRFSSPSRTAQSPTDCSAACSSSDETFKGIVAFNPADMGCRCCSGCSTTDVAGKEDDPNSAIIYVDEAKCSALCPASVTITEGLARCGGTGGFVSLFEVELSEVADSGTIVPSSTTATTSTYISSVTTPSLTTTSPPVFQVQPVTPPTPTALAGESSNITMSIVIGIAVGGTILAFFIVLVFLVRVDHYTEIANILCACYFGRRSKQKQGQESKLGRSSSTGGRSESRGPGSEDGFRSGWYQRSNIAPLGSQGPNTTDEQRGEARDWTASRSHASSGFGSAPREWTDHRTASRATVRSTTPIAHSFGRTLERGDRLPTSNPPSRGPTPTPSLREEYTSIWNAPVDNRRPYYEWGGQPNQRPIPEPIYTSFARSDTDSSTAFSPSTMFTPQSTTRTPPRSAGGLGSSVVGSELPDVPRLNLHNRRKSSGHNVPDLSINTHDVPKQQQQRPPQAGGTSSNAAAVQRTNPRVTSLARSEASVRSISTAHTAINNASQFPDAQLPPPPLPRQPQPVVSKSTTIAVPLSASSAILPPDWGRFNTTTTTTTTSYADPAIAQFIVPTESKALQLSQQQAQFIAQTFRNQLRYAPDPPPSQSPVDAIAVIPQPKIQQVSFAPIVRNSTRLSRTLGSFIRRTTTVTTTTTTVTTVSPAPSSQMDAVEYFDDLPNVTRPSFTSHSSTLGRQLAAKTWQAEGYRGWGGGSVEVDTPLPSLERGIVAKAWRTEGYRRGGGGGGSAGYAERVTLERGPNHKVVDALYARDSIAS
ncbi:hypothetical protein BJ742DRAFT_557234 [Cladochytrium replicatum]|nr:hypothetical protein BJ742DRAFT_557234 [Cladochytrium replicatum]